MADDPRCQKEARPPGESEAMRFPGRAAAARAEDPRADPHEVGPELGRLCTPLADAQSLAIWEMPAGADGRPRFAVLVAAAGAEVKLCGSLCEATDTLAGPGCSHPASAATALLWHLRRAIRGSASFTRGPEGFPVLAFGGGHPDIVAAVGRCLP